MAIKSVQEKARRDSLNLFKKLQRKTRSIYLAAGNAVAEEVRLLETIGMGKKYRLTIASKQQLRDSLLDNGRKVNRSLNIMNTEGIATAVQLNAGAYNRYTAGFMKNLDNLDNEILIKTFTKINHDLVQVQLLKTYGDGLTYSRRIWKSSKLFERDIRNVVAEGIARQRDIIAISKDINQYVIKGKQTLVKRYANIDQSPIRPGETVAEWRKRVSTFKTRISSNVEYNSLRIVRTQIQGAIQDCNIAAADYTPSVESFNWTLSPAHVIYSICEDIEAGNPWTYQNFTHGTPPHPNCLSYTIYIEKPQKEFISDLKAWEKNPTAPGTQYLNDWKSTYYDPAARGDNTNYFDLLARRTNLRTEKVL